ncbi:ankyrin repeat domain-containing protein SOWAHC-like [Sinocyclocheilus grahami]|uniref:ankyrin repeat domain-containing protein SOWAHC-like n=1 Tax=Sinocyclocheilus grahami TaxID=75366 RepID=UPI0007ACD831|nr:PREDICTED: ankyrin repeat domain-containing protein SOWAHC-like [Sinocyclocheilus grahami]
MGEISEASLLDYICSSGGKVKNSDLSKTYKHFINHSDLQLRAKYREDFKLIIDRIAVVKSENGEKYLVLKKKYRQQMQERESGAGKGGKSLKQFHPNPQNDLQVSSPVQNCNPTAQNLALVAWCSGPMITVTEATEPTHTDNQADSTLSQPAVEEKPEELSASDREDDLDKDSGSKSESEQDEECGGSLGSTAVALDPLEKEWIFSAASGKLSHLAQLLKQDSSLANKKDFTSFTALHWAAKHGKEDMTTVLAEAGADINTKAHGGYTPLHIAALHGHRHIFDLLVRTYGAKENLRDYSGHIAYHYLNLRETKLEDHELCDMMVFSPFRHVAHVERAALKMFSTLAQACGFSESTGCLVDQFWTVCLHLICPSSVLFHAQCGLLLNTALMFVLQAEVSECHSLTQAGERRNRKITSLFHSMKKWGSAEELAPVPEERTVAHQLMLPAFRPRKFSR